MDAVSERLRLRHPQRVDLSLDRMRRLCDALGNPERHLPPVVHIAGTNGKGSTAAFLRAMAEAAGLRVHVYSSPHLVRFQERIRLAGELIEDAQLEAALDRIEAVPGVQGTVFENTTAAAFLAMAETPADLAVVEVGLGGRLDSTNVIDQPRLSVIGPIAIDHAEFLGGSIAEIAREKAGILKSGVDAIIARQPGAAFGAIHQAANSVGARLICMDLDFDVQGVPNGLIFATADKILTLPVPALAGSHQVSNAGVAIAAALNLGLPETAIAQGLRRARWPARLQPLSAGPYGAVARAANVDLWLDGGHNPHAARALADWLCDLEVRDPRPLTLIVGMLRSKDAGGFFHAVRGSRAEVFTVGFDGDAAAPEDLAAQARDAGLSARSAASADEALGAAIRAGAGRVVICGSLYLAGAILAASPETWPR